MMGEGRAEGIAYLDFSKPLGTALRKIIAKLLMYG